jgi:hypothetical protein
MTQVPHHPKRSTRSAPPPSWTRTQRVGLSSSTNREHQSLASSSSSRGYQSPAPTLWAYSSRGKAITRPNTLPVKGAERIASLSIWFHCRGLVMMRYIYYIFWWYFEDLESRLKTWFGIDVWCITRNIIYLIYQFSFHIYVAMYLFDVVVALDIQNFEKKWIFLYFLNFTLHCYQ